jgi:hypothetical protein
VRVAIDRAPGLTPPWPLDLYFLSQGTVTITEASFAPASVRLRGTCSGAGNLWRTRHDPSGGWVTQPQWFDVVTVTEGRFEIGDADAVGVNLRERLCETRRIC